MTTRTEILKAQRLLRALQRLVDSATPIADKQSVYIPKLEIQAAKAAIRAALKG